MLNKNKLLYTTAIIGISLLSVIGNSKTANAEFIYYENTNGLTFTVGLDAAAGAFFTRNVNFGQGLKGDKNIDWQEMYVEPIIKFNQSTSDLGNFDFTFSPTFLINRGGFDRADTAQDNEGYAGIEQTNLKWTSDNLFPSLGEDAIEISLGRFDAPLGDLFLIADGNWASSDEGVYWLGPRSAFDSGAMLSFNTSPLSGQLFWLKADGEQSFREMVGTNIEYTNETIGTLGLTAYKNVNAVGSDHAKNTIYGWVKDVPIPNVDNLTFSGGYADQHSNEDVGADANAWHSSLKYSFADADMTPAVTYRYSSFSGDDTSTTKNEAFDPHSYGSSEWGQWYMGEIIGEYYLFNSNARVHMIKADVRPKEGLEIGAIYYNFSLDENNASNHDAYADEFDVYANWSINDNYYLTAVGAMASPDEAANDAFGGNDDNEYLFQVALYMSF